MGSSAARRMSSRPGRSERHAYGSSSLMTLRDKEVEQEQKKSSRA
jgi:hypothetical protein